MRGFLFAGACALALAAAPQARAQDQTDQTPAATTAPAGSGAGDADAGASDPERPSAPIPFDGGVFTITQAEPYGEKVLSYDGKPLAHDYDVFLDRIVRLGDVDVALFDVGPGGNQCGPGTLIAWKDGGAIRSVTVEQDNCGAPPAAVAGDAIYFVPYLLPGDSRPALRWTPNGGLVTAGLLAYAPEAGAGWDAVDPSTYDNIIDAFHNEAVYRAARTLLGRDMTGMVTSLLVGGGTEKTASGAFYATGCVPHDCGGNDGFMAVDARRHKLYFARREGKDRTQSWPAMKTWPAEIRDAYRKGLD